MNFLLHLNKKNLILAIFSILFFLFAFVLYKKIFLIQKDEISQNESSIFDIINPKFTINNENNKIKVKAKRGNFLKNDNILLDKDVVFVSPNYQIKTDKVFFNQHSNDAESNSKTLFNAKNIEIISEGFNINNNGNTILFNGSSSMKIEK